MEKSQTPVYDFYKKGGETPEGLTFEKFLASDDAFLERCHSHVQWVFPLQTPSAMVPNAPVIDAVELELLKRDDEVKERALLALNRMCQFWGFPSYIYGEGRGITVPPPKAKPSWVRRGDHNYLRMTRALWFFRSMGMMHAVNSLFRCLTEVYLAWPKEVSEETYMYWLDAAAN